MADGAKPDLAILLRKALDTIDTQAGVMQDMVNEVRYARRDIAERDKTIARLQRSLGAAREAVKTACVDGSRPS